MNPIIREDDIKLRNSKAKSFILNTRREPEFKELPQILRNAHIAAGNENLPVAKTFNRVTKSFTWPGMHADVKDYFTGCKICNPETVILNLPPAVQSKNEPYIIPFY